MASLRDHFQHFYAPGEAEVASALRMGLVALDTNVLLSLYRFQAGARDDLFRVLERLGDRLWIPYQVGLEFHRNRLSVINAQEKYFGTIRDDLNSAVKTYIDKMKAFSSRIALDRDRESELEAAILRTHGMVIEDVDNAEQSNDVQLSTLDSDEVLTRLEILLNDKIGPAMSPDELNAAKKEASRRIEAKIPPGYMDKAKADPTGDYLVWLQLKQQAATRKIPVVFVTDDRKEDWYRREQGMTLGARIELREEMQIESGVSFLVMTTGTFLVQAKRYLEVTVSPQTVDQAEELAERISFDSALDALAATEQELLASRENIQILDMEILRARRRFIEADQALRELSDQSEDAGKAGQSLRAEFFAAQNLLQDLEFSRNSAVVETEARERDLRVAEEAILSLESKTRDFPVLGTNVKLRIGDRVLHKKFGTGTIVSSDTSTDSPEYKVKFDNSRFGTKHLVARYSPMVKI